MSTVPEKRQTIEKDWPLPLPYAELAGSSECLKSGPMRKRGPGKGIGKNLTWQTRMFVMHRGFLYYFENAKAKKYKGVIPLEFYTTAERRDPEGGEEHCFALTSPERKVHPCLNHVASESSGAYILFRLHKRRARLRVD